MELSDQIKGILATLPDKPGCYIMKNQESQVIYVGKAINLRNRVRSYFNNTKKDIKTTQLVSNIVDLEWITVDSELEALILEMNLIKRYRPRYNILLKDDKRYPYIKVHWASPFPKVTITRNVEQDGSRYFGPYTSMWAVHRTLDLLRRIFPYLTCDREITGHDLRACLYYDIKLCCAPCIGIVTKDEYRQMIDDLCHFLEGKTDPIIKRLEQEMAEAAEGMMFEKAAVIRDQIKAIEVVVQRQKVITDDDRDSDVIAVAREDGEACVQIFFIRSGKMIGREYFILEGTEEADDSEVISEFLKQFYSEAITVPDQVLLPTDIEEAKLIQSWLKNKRNSQKVELRVPRRGNSRQLVEMATTNATETLQALRAQWQADTNKQSVALGELQEALNLVEPPNKIECYDISNIQGTASVGSMVVFEQGVPAKAQYRRFNIKTVEGPDDFSSMEEVLRRRLKRWQSSLDADEQVGKKKDPAFAILPDLLLVDGGKGQLGRAVKVLEEFELFGKVPVAGLAKENEELFLPAKPDPVILPRHSQGLYLIQRIRDEAHRFAITAHRNKRSKLGLASQLDSVTGIGPAKRRALLAKFGSVGGIRNASLDELTQVAGITLKLAQNLKNELE